jgi:hypothetical protein
MVLLLLVSASPILALSLGIVEGTITSAPAPSSTRQIQSDEPALLILFSCPMTLPLLLKLDQMIQSLTKLCVAASPSPHCRSGNTPSKPYKNPNFNYELSKTQFCIMNYKDV